MSQLIQTFGLPFLFCVMMGLILGYMGIHVLKREVIFIDIALAQVAAVGAIIAHLVFHAHHDSLLSYLCSLAAVFSMAAFYALLRTNIVQISLEAIIGISYAIAAAAALFLVGVAPGGHLHIQDILSGSLLWISWRDVTLALLLFSVTGLLLYLVRKPLVEISDNYQNTLGKSFRGMFWDFIFYLLLGTIITFSVQTAGIVVVFAYLIIPATISAIFSSRLGLQLVIIWIAAILASIMGVLFTHYLDSLIGPAVALFLGMELIIAAIINKFRLVFS